MLEDPGFDARELTAASPTSWAVEASSFTFVPGYDRLVASYRVATADAPAFLKVHLGPVAEAPLEVPRALLDAGVPNACASSPG